MTNILYLLLLFTAAVATTTTVEQTIQMVWQGMIERNPGEPFLIHRPYSETPGDAVSEGVGYGLIMAMYCNDQEHFDMLLDGAETTMWNGQCYNWRVDSNGWVTGSGGATDAEQDIAAMLIMAKHRVDHGEWTDYRNGFYEQRARTILGSLWQQGVTADGTLRPGYYWGGEKLVNVGYFAPAWYRMFARFDLDHDWMSVVDRSYEILQRSPGYENGLVPDWMTPYGAYTNDLGYNAYGDGHYMYKDAIRVLWRIGTDYYWNKDERAKDYMNNAYSFIAGRGANFYQMDGSLVPKEDVWVFDGGAKRRPRREHSPLTIGMWSIPMMLMGDLNEQESATEELMKYHQDNATYWGLDEGDEDVEHNEMYFEQFLASFGALFMTDLFHPY
jgi:hypothetical protein